MEIVTAAVDHHCAADDLIDAKSVCPHRQIGMSAAHQQRWQISGVRGMRHRLRIVVPARGSKSLPAATVSFMDMEGKKAVLPWKAGKLCHHQNTAALLIKPHLPAQAWRVRTSADTGCRSRTTSITIHPITSCQLMQPAGKLSHPFVVCGGIVDQSSRPGKA